MGNSTTRKEVSMRLAQAFLTKCRSVGMNYTEIASLAGCSGHYVIKRWVEGVNTMHTPTRDHLEFVIGCLDKGMKPRNIPKRERASKIRKTTRANSEGLDPGSTYDWTPTPPKPTRNSDDVEAYVALFSGLDKSTRWSVVHALLRTLEAK